MLRKSKLLTGVVMPVSVRNGYLPQQTLYRLLLAMLKLKFLIRSWIGSGNGICFNSSLLPPYLKRAQRRQKVATMPLYPARYISHQ
ncbi:MAG: hypothetical protein ACTS73_09620 [Arsenophonus sp. NEOnobi-MAG3]